MTINEAISKVDALKVNTYGRKEKIDWLSTLDGIIKKEIIDFHEGVNKDEEIVKYINSVRAKYEKDLNEYMKVNEVSLEEAKANVPFVEVSYKDAKEYIEANRNDITFNGYNADTPADTQLLVPAPYDDIYLRWLEAQIDYCNEDTTQYANSMAMFNVAYSSFDRYYNRAYMPLGRKIKFF